MSHVWSHPRILVTAFAFIGALANPLTPSQAHAADPTPKPFGLRVLSATVRGQALPDTEVVLTRAGQPPVTATTDRAGRINIQHALGDDADVTLTIKKPGFSPLVTECPCNGLSYALSATLGQPEAIRVVLNWGAEPAYLDLHAVYPGNHVYWQATKGADAALDVRATDAFGPATITIGKRHADEQYVLAVHNWSAQGRYGNKKLSASRARVFVYVGDSLVKSYHVPTGRTGALWVLFAIDGDGAFHDINNIVDITELASVRPYMNQLTQRTNFGLPQHVSDADMKAAEALVAEASSAARGGRHTEAVRQHTRALELYPSYTRAVSGLIASYIALGSAAEAVWATRKLIALHKVPKSNGFRVPNERIAVAASSHLRPWKHYTFDPLSLLDDNLWTSWQPDRKPAGGVGEWFELKFETPQLLTGFEVSNGFRLIDELGDLYTMNNRIKDAVIKFSDGSEMPVTFEDIAGDKTILLPTPKETSSVRLTVKAVYKGTKWNDLAVSEFHPLGTK